MRNPSRPLLGLLAASVALTACAPPNVKISGDSTLPPATLIDARPTTSGPPTTPFPTAYPTIPPVSAAPPYWSPVVWVMQDVQDFLALVDAALYDLGAEHTLDAYNGAATLDNGTTIDLTLLAAQLTKTSRASWTTAIDTYLENVLSPGRGDTSMAWEETQPLLRVRVGTLESLGLDLDQGVVQPIVDNLVVAVVIERDTGITLVSSAQLDAWRRTSGQVLSQAIAQTLARPTVTKADGPFTAVVEDVLASARLLDPTTVLPSGAPNGYLVAIATFGQFVGIPVGDTVTEATIIAMAQQAAEDFSTLENPASTDLYWWRNGRVDILRVRGGEVEIPEELRALLPA